MKKITKNDQLIRLPVDIYFNPFTQEITGLLPHGLTMVWRNFAHVRAWCNVFIERMDILKERILESSTEEKSVQIDDPIRSFESHYILCANLIYQLDQLEDYLAKTGFDNQLHPERDFFESLKEWSWLPTPPMAIVATN